MYSLRKHEHIEWSACDYSHNFAKTIHSYFLQGHPAEVFRKKGVPQCTFSWLGNVLLLTLLGIADFFKPSWLGNTYISPGIPSRAEGAG